MKNIITIGGGTGTFNLVSGLKQIENIFLHTIVTMSDDGGSTGTLRDEYGILPPGDLRRALVALSDENKTEFLRKLFAYRFESGFLKGQNLGNLIMFASEKIEKNYGKALNKLEEVFEIKKGKTYPATEEQTRLLAQLENGEYIIGETNIDVPKHNGNLKIKDFYVIKQEYAEILKISKNVNQEDIFNYTIQKALKNNPNGNNKLEEVFEKADYIILGPGDLYTSILPNLLVGKNKELLINSKAKKIYIGNLFTKFGETNGFRLSDFLGIFEKYLGKDIFDYILVQDENKLNISKDILEKYKNEGKELVKTDIKEKRIISTDLICSGTYLRHDKDKLANNIKNILNMKKAIFMDRDGTINKLKKEKYICNIKDVEIIAGTKETLKKLKEKGYLLIVITNQTGVGAGYYTKEQAENVNKEIEKQLGINFDAIYSCYHNPSEGCNCRKPKTGLVEQAMEDFSIDIKNSIFIGDKEKDIITGKNIGCKTGYVGKNIINTKADFYGKDIKEIIKQYEKQD